MGTENQAGAECSRAVCGWTHVGLLHWTQPLRAAVSAVPGDDAWEGGRSAAASLRRRWWHSWSQQGPSVLLRWRHPQAGALSAARR